MKATEPTPEVTVTWKQARAWRLARHLLDTRAPRGGMIAVTERIAGLHAQLLSSAELSLWARVSDLQPADVRDALWVHRTLVKTWAMRGTLHLLSAAEYPLWQAALSTHHRFLRDTWLTYCGLSREQSDQLTNAVAVALEDQVLTREELAERVAAATGSPELGSKVSGSWGMVLKPAAFQGNLCFGPSRGVNVCFTNPRQWIGALHPPPAPIDQDAALREIFLRYLSAYGPAGRDDFAHWWGAAASQIQLLIDSLRAELTPVSLEGKLRWMRSIDVEDLVRAEVSRSLRLLPAFDPYVVATSRHVTHMIAGPNGRRIFRPQGWISPVILVNGRIEGVWKHEKRGPAIVVELEPFVTLPSWARRKAEEEAASLARFLEADLDRVWK